MTSDIDLKIRDALNTVHDPCSVAVNAPLGLVDMGLVVGWSIDEEANLSVRLCVTSPGCIMAPHLVRAAEDKLRKIPELASVRVVVESRVFWTENRMTPAGREALDARRRRSPVATALEPQQWRRRSGTASSESENRG
jgi:metal-sulfur cluster biosynthetic enzyme